MWWIRRESRPCPSWVSDVQVRYSGYSRNEQMFAMKYVSKQEKEVQELAHVEREQLALARQRDREIESGEKQALTEEEFRQMTGG